MSGASNDVIVFTETGTWQQPAGKPISFSNAYRWTNLGQMVRLEHLRFGPDRPVLLFDLQPIDETHWKQVTSHACGEDQYAATLKVEPRRLIVAWTVIGPGKQEKITYDYLV